MRKMLFATILMGVAATASAAVGDLAAISDKDASSAMRTALTQGASSAVATLGRTDGFLGNPQVRIPLPPTLKKAEKLMRKAGMGKQADELLTAMNRAAEAAVPEAKTLLVDAVKKMTVEDAKSILTGGDDAATQYFRRATGEQLREKFMPVVKQATAKVQLAATYDKFAGQAAQFGLLGKSEANLDEYVTDKALDGLYLMIAEEEKKIRKDPLGQTSGVVKKVFGSLAP